jgi:hypothetical protein
VVSAPAVYTCACPRQANDASRPAGPLAAYLRAEARTWSRCWRRFGHSQHMDTGERPAFGVCATVDVHYLSTGGARAAAVLAADAPFAHLLAEHTAVVSRVPAYRPG